MNDRLFAQDAVIAAHRGARALVTGGAGFIGTRLCDFLQSCGWTVWSASRRPAGPAAAHRHLQVDLAEAGATQALVRETQPDYVFHLAAHVWATTGFDLVLPTFHSNLHSTVNLLHALFGTNCRRVIIAGSQIEPNEEAGEAVPVIPYAVSKWASSEYVRMFQTLYDVPGVIARVFMAYGPGQGESKLIPYVVNCLLRGERPKLTSGGRLGDWIFVDDVAQGLARTAVAPVTPGCTVDLGSGTLIATADIVRKIYELLKCDEQPVFGTLPDRPVEPSRLARIDETRRLLDWSPSIDLSEGLLHTINAYLPRSAEEGAARSPRRPSPATH